MDIKKREISFDIIRLFAIFLVVFSHIIAVGIFVFRTTIGNVILLDFFFHLGVPLFFMLSGALTLKNKLSVKEFYKKKISKFIVPFIFWNIFYMCLFELGNITNNFMFRDFSFSKLGEFLYMTFYPWYHLWFLNCLFILYFISPFIANFVHNEKNKKYFFAFVALYIILDIFKINILNRHFYFSLSYLIYFVIGYYLSKMDFKRYKIPLFCLFGIGFVILFMVRTFFAEFYVAHNHVEFVMYYLSYARWWFIVLASLFFMIIRSFNFENLSGTKVGKAISSLANLTFGVYLVHPLFLQILRMIFKSTGIVKYGNLYIIFITYVGSFLFTFLIKKIKYVKNIV